MKLSIIIPTFNSASVLGRALDSIVSQIFVDWEVLVMDGGSKDNTIQIANAYHDNRIRTFSEPDKGIYDAMNKGIKKSKGEWLYFLGSDDYLLNSNVLQSVFTQAIEHYDVIYGEAEYSHLCDEFHGEWTMSNIFVNRCHQAIIYRKRVLEKYHGYNLKYKEWADYDLNLKWFFDKKIKKKYIGTPIAHFSDGGCSDGHPDEEFEKDREYIYLTRGRKYFSRYQQIQFAKMVVRKSDKILVKGRYFVLSRFWQQLIQLRKVIK